MKSNYLMGIDVGTFSAKGVLTRLDGTIVASHTVEYKLNIPCPGWAEHDADEIWWKSLVCIIRQLIKKAAINPKEILALACSAMGPALLPVDSNGRPLRSAILYGIDTRAKKEIKELNELLGPNYIFDSCGNSLSAQSVSPKILWVRKTEPHLFEQTYKLLNSTSYLVFKLTGEYVVDDYTAAAFSGLYDIKAKDWSPKLYSPVCDLAQLPTVMSSTDIAGYITPEAAEITGLAEKTPVIAGTEDALAEAVGIGVSDNGETMLSYGTTFSIIQVLSKQKIDISLWSGPNCLKGKYILHAAMATSASLTHWFRDNFGQLERMLEDQQGLNSYQLLAQGCESVLPGSEGLIVLPYFSGERSPINDPRARGVIAGLTLAHTKNHVYRALLEGVAYGVRHNIETMNAMGAMPTRLVVAGGGVKNQLWLQIISDVLQMPQEVPEITIGAAYGDAFMAGVGVGVFSNLEVLKNTWVKTQRVIEPRREVSALYSDYYDVYLKFYQNIKEQLHVLADLGSLRDQ